ncbi:MAG: hypothetical protein KME35_17765 [Aphanocapsa sp. GSE-SYN-MK-11-07L]|jgi:hypothetical protein|nr:hypothetical protein [Aphanocapsa sp. GSE-SYN-MK-11-07L]
MTTVSPAQAGETRLTPISNLLAQQMTENNCKQAFLDSKKRLEKMRGVQVVRAETRKHGYANFPSGRSQEYFIVIANNQLGENVMNSPVLLTSIASTITSACSAIGFVNFAINQTDWVRGYGVVGNRVTAFKCLDLDIRNREQTYIDGQGNIYQEVSWGYQRYL